MSGWEGEYEDVREDSLDDSSSGIEFFGALISYGEISFRKKLGSGHFGEVFIGECRGQTVAVKVPRARLTEAQVADFRKEIDAMSKVVHPNIVGMLGAYFPPENSDDPDDVLMIVMEFFGADLEQMLFDTSKTLSLTRRMNWAKQVALGMCWLHGAGYVHLDLKPANLLLDTSTDVVKIADFGLAVLVPPDQGFLCDAAKGTPVYAAPELYLESRIAPECDVYSFAICMFEFITRQMAYSGMHLPESLEEFFDLVADEDMRPWNDQVPVDENIPESLVELVMHCWVGDPAERPSFRGVLRAMPSILVDCAIPYQPMRTLWLSFNVAGQMQQQIPLAQFCQSFLSFIDCYEARHQIPYAEPLLRQLFSTKKDGEPVVDYEYMGKILSFLPPMPARLTRGWFSEIAALASQPWFWGDVSSTEAQKRLVGVTKRRFLIRFSSVAPHYTISIRSDRNVAHRRIIRDPNSPQVWLEKKLSPKMQQTHFENLEQLVKAAKVTLKVKPLDNGPFEWVFLNTDPYSGDQGTISGYDADVK